MLSYLLYFVFLVIYNKASFLKNSFFVQIGNISFALYLIHQSLGLSTSDYLTPMIGVTFSKAIGISVSIIGAFLITHYFDAPLRKKIKKIYNLKTKKPMAV